MTTMDQKLDRETEELKQTYFVNILSLDSNYKKHLLKRKLEMHQESGILPAEFKRLAKNPAFMKYTCTTHEKMETVTRLGKDPDAETQTSPMDFLIINNQSMGNKVWIFLITML